MDVPTVSVRPPWIILCGARSGPKGKPDGKWDGRARTIENGSLQAMKNRDTATVDAAGRLVLPKRLRERAGIVAGQVLRLRLTDEGRIEVEPVSEPARIETRGRWRVVVTPEGAPPIAESQVEEVRRELRESTRDA